MKIVQIDGANITIESSKKDLAQLSKLLEWVVTNQSIMDEGTIMMEPDEIYPATRKWIDLVYKAIK